MADFENLSPSEKLGQLIARDNQRLLEMALETDLMVNDTIERSLRQGVKKINESFDVEIEKIRRTSLNY